MKALEYLKLLKSNPIFAQNEIMLDEAIKELEELSSIKKSNVYKIKLISEDYNTQIEKKIYENKKSFLKYGKEYFDRKHGTDYNSKNMLAYIKCYIMSEDEWVEINIPNEFFK